MLLVSCSSAPKVGDVIFENEQVTVTQLTENVKLFETFDNTTMWLVEGKDKAVLIDTGTECEDLDKIVDQLTDLPYEVLLTHAHYDHAGNVEYFDHVYLHPADSAVRRTNMGDYQGEVRPIAEGDVFDLGGVELEVYLMPGHTPGSVVYVDKKRGDCFAGDAFGAGECWLQCIPTLPIQVFYDSCVKMESIMDEYGVTKIWSGHYPYLKRALGKEHIEIAKRLATKIMARDFSTCEPFAGRSMNPSDKVLKISEDYFGIVFDPDAID